MKWWAVSVRWPFTSFSRPTKVTAVSSDHSGARPFGSSIKVVYRTSCCPSTSSTASPYPGQDCEPVAAAVREDEQVARKRIASVDRPHHAGERVDPLAVVHGFDGNQDAAVGQRAQHATASEAVTSRVTASDVSRADLQAIA